MLYGEVNVFKPKINRLQPFEMLYKNKIDYIFLTRDALQFGDANSFIRNYIVSNDDCFEELALTESFVGLEVFKVNQQSRCLKTIDSI